MAQRTELAMAIMLANGVLGAMPHPGARTSVPADMISRQERVTSSGVWNNRVEVGDTFPTAAHLPAVCSFTHFMSMHWSTLMPSAPVDIIISKFMAVSPHMCRMTGAPCS